MMIRGSTEYSFNSKEWLDNYDLLQSFQKFWPLAINACKTITYVVAHIIHVNSYIYMRSNTKHSGTRSTCMYTDSSGSLADGQQGTGFSNYILGSPRYAFYCSCICQLKDNSNHPWQHGCTQLLTIKCHLNQCRYIN